MLKHLDKACRLFVQFLLGMLLVNSIMFFYYGTQFFKAVNVVAG